MTHYLWTQSLTYVIYTLPTGNGNNYILHASRWLKLLKLDLAQSCDSTAPSGLRILSTVCSLFFSSHILDSPFAFAYENVRKYQFLVRFSRILSDHRNSSSAGKGATDESANLSLVPETHRLNKKTDAANCLLTPDAR